MRTRCGARRETGLKRPASWVFTPRFLEGRRLTQLQGVWQRALLALENSMSATAVSTWFDDAQLVSLEGGRATVRTSGAFKRDFIAGRYLPLLNEVLTELSGHAVETHIVCGEDPAQAAAAPARDKPALIENEYTFERFVVGSSNKFAHAAALAVARSPAKAYNPLFIYGGSGLGKTHLLHAIANEARVRLPGFRIVYIKGDDFTNELIACLQVGKMAEFREKYRRADILLVDDIQFIAGKVSTQEEFFHTFNTLYMADKQIILSSDRPPKEMAKLEDRLRTRFECGLMADVQPPEYETRLAIIKNKAGELGMEMSDEVAEYIAQNITANVRQLEGTMKKVLALRDLMRSNVDRDTVERAIRDIIRINPGMKPTPQLIVDEVGVFYSVSDRDMKGQRRDADIVAARQISMYLIRALTDCSFPEIGRFFSGRHHATVLHAVDKVEERMRMDPEFSGTIKSLMDNISNK